MKLILSLMLLLSLTACDMLMGVTPAGKTAAQQAKKAAKDYEKGKEQVKKAEDKILESNEKLKEKIDEESGGGNEESK